MTIDRPSPSPTRRLPGATPGAPGSTWEGSPAPGARIRPGGPTPAGAFLDPATADGPLPAHSHDADDGLDAFLRSTSASSRAAGREPRSRDRAESLDSGALRIAQVAPPFESVPPAAYGGTERVVDALTRELVARGHIVTLFASGDSDVPCELVPTVPRSVRALGPGGGAPGYYTSIIIQVLAQADAFDIIHTHLDFAGLLLAAAASVPVVSTFHGRLDAPYAATALALGGAGAVAISRSQAGFHPTVPWAGIVHNGLDLSGAPFERRRSDDLIFVGRITPEKGIVDAIEVARLSGRTLRIVAKIGPTGEEQAYAEEVFKPALGRADTEFIGELGGHDRDALLAGAYALLMPGAWPEPFGLTAIESLACGTPVIARKVGALPEIVRQGVDGFLADDVAEMAFRLVGVAELDRSAIRDSVLERFSAARMTDGYEAIYRRRIGAAALGYREGPASAAPAAARPRDPAPSR